MPTGGAAAGVAHREVQPIGQQGLFRVPEHAPHIGGVFLAGIKISVVPDLHRQLHFDFIQVEKDDFPVLWLLLQFPVAQVEYLGNPVPHKPQGFLPVRNEIVQGILQKNIVVRRDIPEMAQLVHGAEVNGRIAYARAYGDHVIPGQEYPKWDILDREIGIGGYGQPGFAVGVIGLDRHGLLLIGV